MANPHAGSRKRVEKAENDPATGNRTAISPRAWTVEYIMTPIMAKAMRTEAGPPSASDFPEPTNRPVPALSVSRYHLLQPDGSRIISPIEPPIAIICKCLLFNLLCSGDAAVAAAASSRSNTFPSAPICFNTWALGSRLKLSRTRCKNELRRPRSSGSSYVEGKWTGLLGHVRDVEEGDEEEAEPLGCPPS